PRGWRGGRRAARRSSGAVCHRGTLGRSRVNLTLAALEQFVPSQVRNRGAEYARRGAVRLHPRRSAVEPVSAIVTGSEEYLVTLRYEERALWTTCTCPYFDENVEICKHVWATLCECAEKNLPFPGPVDDLLVDDQSESIPLDDEDDDVRIDFDDYDEPFPPLHP